MSVLAVPLEDLVPARYATGRTEPLRSAGQPLTVPSDATAFDISPDGKRVAYQRTVTFSGELSVLDLHR